MTDPIALYLPVFSLTDVAETEPSIEAPDLAMPESAFLDEDPAFAEDDAEARIAQAREEALAEAAIATEAALAAQAAELEQRHADAMADERRRWAEQEGEGLAEQLRAGLATLERGLAESVADILQPFVGRAVRAKAAEELRDVVKHMLANGDDRLIRVGGPSDLVEPLRMSFLGNPAIEFADTDACEVSIETGETTVRTQLQPWADALDAHLAGAA